MMVRTIKATDLDKLLLLYQHLHEDDIEVSKDILNNVWQDIITNKSVAYFIVEIDDLIVSACNVTLIPNLTRGARPIALIENVVTHSNYRNKGFGKAVMQAGITFTKQNNCYKIMLLSTSKRNTAHQFYKSLGFNSDDKIGFTIKL